MVETRKTAAPGRAVRPQPNLCAANAGEAARAHEKLTQLTMRLANLHIQRDEAETPALRDKVKEVLAQVAKDLAESDEATQLQGLSALMAFIHGTSEPIPEPLSLLDNKLLRMLVHNLVSRHPPVQLLSCRL